jgi:DNA-binding NtrC family response regulator
VTGVDPRVLDALFEHPWRGNLRELENALSRALLHAEGGELLPGHLELETFPIGVTPEPAVGRGALNPRQEALLEGLPEGQRITSVEYAEHHGVTSRTALRDLVELAERGYLVREGARRGMRFRRVMQAVSGQ